MVVTAQLAPSVRESSVDSSTGPRRSPGELRRRRWADARKKGRVISKELGVPVECIDCIRSDSGELRAALERSNCIWVTGGNTFFLWQAMRHSGLDGLIQQRVAAGALYVGCSAGAIVAGCSIETAFWKGWDDPSVAPEMDWKRPSNLQGMGLVNASFFPHFDSSWAPLVEQKRSELGHMLVCLDEMNAFVTGNESSGSLGDASLSDASDMAAMYIPHVEARECARLKEELHCCFIGIDTSRQSEVVNLTGWTCTDGFEIECLLLGREPALNNLGGKLSFPLLQEFITPWLELVGGRHPHFDL
ncbi:MAG: hypothetical protein SGPRY_002282 [Prymnesium sp.]